VALASGAGTEALDLARRAVDLAKRSGNAMAELGAMLTEARALRVSGDPQQAETRYGEAAAIARDGSVPSRLRDVLREWAQLRAEAGDHRGAYELTNEALAVN
jgi:tetratricopeptide (TPR) repeat protein